MKKFILFLFVLAYNLTIAQQYQYVESIGTEAPYNFKAGERIEPATFDEFLSEQTIPFEWNFYDQAVDTYLISDNGYITFDLSEASSNPENTSIPDVSAPKAAIFAHWDDHFLETGSHRITTSTYGVSPNRVHVIQWYRMGATNTSIQFYFAIRLYECGDFDIIHNHGPGANGTATVGVQNFDGSEGTLLAGPDFNMWVDGSSADNTNDKVYHFINNDITRDASVRDITSSNTAFSGIYSLSGQLLNKGSESINSMTINYTANGGEPKTMELTGLNIPAGVGSFDFVHEDNILIGVPGSVYEVCTWVDVINGDADQRTCNDAHCETIVAISGNSVESKVVLVEEFTGAWCGNCPDGHLLLEELQNQFPNQFQTVAIHYNDAMEIEDGIRDAFSVIAYPSVMIDRVLFEEEGFEVFQMDSWAANLEAQLNTPSPVSAGIVADYNGSTRTIFGTLSAEFADYAYGDMRLNLYIIEDQVIGEGIGFDQVNYNDNTAGHPLEGMGNPIVGYEHQHVLRALPFGPFGVENVIPVLAEEGEIYTHTFSYILPEEFNQENIKLVATVSKFDMAAGERTILNTSILPLPEGSVGIDNMALASAIEVYPNPAQDFLTISWDSDEVVQKIGLTDLTGRTIFEARSSSLNNASTILVDLTNHHAGFYILTVKKENVILTKRIAIQ